MSLSGMELRRPLAAWAAELGLGLLGVAPVGPPPTAGAYRAWVEKGYHGEMGYLARPDAVARREDLSLSLPGVQAVVVAGIEYCTPPADDGPGGDDPSRGLISRYAWDADYHDGLGDRLDRLAGGLTRELGAPLGHRRYVDTGPLLERDLAARAGLGFIGKNTNLINPGLGSWLLLGEVLVTAPLPPGPAVAPGAVRRGTCGRCTRCLDACPTKAFVAPYVLDSRRCISYLTIELKGAIPQDLRPLLGNRIFGCDLCQEVCPWNRRFARPFGVAVGGASSDMGMASCAARPRDGRCGTLSLPGILALDEEGFRRRFQASPVRRAKRRGLLRNAAVALGNWGDPGAVGPLAQALRDPEPLVRAHAGWALGRIGTVPALRALAEALDTEGVDDVRKELVQALASG